MESRSSVFAIAAALVVGGDVTVFGEMSPPEFIALYEPAAEKLERFYSHMTLEAVVTRSKMQTKRPFIPRQRLIMRMDGDKMRIDRFVPQPGGGETVRVSVRSTDGWFTVRREPDQERFVLSSLSTGDNKSANRLRSRYYFVFAPFCESGGLLLANKVRAKNTRITSIEEEDRDGETLVKVSYERDIRYNGNSVSYVGYDVFSKTMGWALRESVAGGGESQRRGRIDYDGMIDGVPLLKTAEYWRQQGDERFNILHCEVTRIEPETAPPEAFELATLVGELRQEQNSSYWLLLIAGAVVLVAILAVLSRLAVHRRAAP